MRSVREPNAASESAGTASAEFNSVLVPLDGSRPAERALPSAHDLAARFNAELHVLTANVNRSDRWWYQRYIDRVCGQWPGVTAHLSDEADVAGAIGSFARRADPCLVCIATHGRSRSAALLGSTFAAVASRVRTPLLGVGPRVQGAVVGSAEDATVEAGRICVCLDGRPTAELVAPVAAAWARRLGLRVTLLTTADPVLLRSEAAHKHTPSARRYGPDGNPGSYLREIAARPTFDGLEVDVQVLWGLAHAHICIGEHLDRNRATIVAVTSHARIGLARAALGSEAARIVHRSPAPVLVQPITGDHAGVGQWS
jgi:nucleotide-binding universal stress UspA family protein